jgi:hypothetical protein
MFVRGISLKEHILFGLYEGSVFDGADGVVVIECFDDGFGEYCVFEKPDGLFGCEPGVVHVCI